MKRTAAMFVRCGGAAVLAACALHAPRALCAGDEIQVYVDDLLARGERGVELHANYVPRGRLAADYPGEQPPGHVLRVTPELSFGLGGNFDWGVYLPFSASRDSGSAFSDYAKLRGKYLVRDERPGTSEFYGLNIEVARSPRRVSPSAWSGELRGIVGMRRGDWLLAMNPILSLPLSTSVAGSSVELEVALKAARQVGAGSALGIEHYAELGPLRRPTLGAASAQTTFAVVDFEGKGWDINVGVGHGWTAGADRRVVKMVLGLPF